MGYEIHITRKESWSDESGDEISLDEWKQLIATDADLRLDDYAEIDLPEGTLRVENEGIAVWTGWIQNEIGGNQAWFNYVEGNISIKNPDTEILKKMHLIARSLHAKVQGDDDEEYNEDGNVIGESVPSSSGSGIKWWQFWK
ncbi:MAG: hypothetical protein QM501_09130 [Gimesia sp.]